jgi:hypothetical protein
MKPSCGMSAGTPIIRDQPTYETQLPRVPVNLEGLAMQADSHHTFLDDTMLMFHAEILDDLETVRIANVNRLEVLTRVGPDADGVQRGFGYTLDHPAVIQLAVLVETLKAAEKQAERNLTKHMQAHPLGPWMASCRGIGDKQGARLLAAIGDPYWHHQRGTPRLVSELWSYCGLGVWEAENGVGIAPYRKRNHTLNWSPDARKRVWLIAESIKKSRGAYRWAYDEGRTKYADAVHKLPCVRCGPAGKPAAVGSPLSKGHQQARAMRLMAKEILRGLWVEAERLHLLQAAA